jgi:hypothetical protein
MRRVFLYRNEPFRAGISGFAPKKKSICVGVCRSYWHECFRIGMSTFVMRLSLFSMSRVSSYWYEVLCEMVRMYWNFVRSYWYDLYVLIQSGHLVIQITWNQISPYSEYLRFNMTKHSVENESSFQWYTRTFLSLWFNNTEQNNPNSFESFVEIVGKSY